MCRKKIKQERRGRTLGRQGWAQELLTFLLTKGERAGVQREREREGEWINTWKCEVMEDLLEQTEWRQRETITKWRLFSHSSGFTARSLTQRQREGGEPTLTFSCKPPRRVAEWEEKPGRGNNGVRMRRHAIVTWGQSDEWRQGRHAYEL